MSAQRRPAPTELRLLSSAVAGAPQHQLARVVSLIDALPDRAEADRLLERVRPRLRGLGLPRPLNLTRLLFMPLDGIIVPSPRWQPGGTAVPRSALKVLSTAVEAALGSMAAEIEACCARCTMEQSRIIEEMGGALWPAAAKALPEAPPRGWAASGLAERDYAPLRALCAVGWRHAVRTWPALQAVEGPSEALLREALEGPVQEGGLAVDVVLRCLMAAATHPASAAAMAIRLAPGETGAIHRAVDDFLRRPDLGSPRDAAGGVGGAAATSRAVFQLIEDFEASGLLALPARRERLNALRKTTDEACRESFREVMTSELLAPVTTLAAAPESEVGTVMPALEETARALRRIEIGGRRLGGAEGYDAALRSAATAIVQRTGQGGAGGLCRVDALRLLEILVGPDAAERLVPRT